MKKAWMKKAALAAAVALSGISTGALAATTYVFDGTNVSDIPGLTGFSTTGAMMGGMSVTVDFVGGGSETAIWAATGAVSGGAFGKNWSLTESGDTFVGIDQAVQGLWQFNIADGSGLQIRKLTLSGNPGLTVFDVDTYDTCQYAGQSEDQCSDGSARGSRLRFANGLIDATVTYSDIVSLNPAKPLGDIFHVVSMYFGEDGIRQSFAFDQDTDNDSRYGTPEPGTLALLGVAMLGAAASRRRKA